MLNRWSDDFAAYHRYIDHAVHDVAYVCTPNAAAALRASRIAHIEQLSEFDDEDALHAAVRACRSALDGIDRLVALSEFELMAAARLHNSFSIPGDLPDAVVRFHDKAVMKHAIAAAGLRVPRFAALENLTSPDAEPINTTRFPLIAKPRTGAASVGVRRVDTEAQFNALLPTLPLVECECEEYIEGTIYHVDGFVVDRAFVIARASRYINTCLEFARGKPLGSVMLDPGPLNDALLAFADPSLRALALVNGPFHLEIIRGPDALYFLEIGARMGRGRSLSCFAICTVLTCSPCGSRSGQVTRHVSRSKYERRSPHRRCARGRFLMLPETVGKVFIDAQSPKGIAALCETVLPKQNHVFNGAGGYDTILARFRYRGGTEHEIAAAIHATLRDSRFTLAKVATLATFKRNLARPEFAVKPSILASHKALRLL